MNARTAKRLRKESGDATPREYFMDGKPYKIPSFITGFTFQKTINAETSRKIYQNLKKEYYNK